MMVTATCFMLAAVLTVARGKVIPDIASVKYAIYLGILSVGVLCLLVHTFWRLWRQHRTWFNGKEAG